MIHHGGICYYIWRGIKETSRLLYQINFSLFDDVKDGRKCSVCNCEFGKNR